MKTPASRGLSALALVCVTAALVTRGLSSGTGQAIESPGQVLVLDAIGAVAALAALGARFLDREPGLTCEKGVLAALGAFLALALAGALHGATGSWRTFFSWAALAALGLAVRDLSRHRDVARHIAGTVLGVVCASAILGAYDYFIVFPEIREIVLSHQDQFPTAWHDRVRNPMAAGPYVLPNHFGCALGMLLPLALVVTVAFVRGGDRPRAVASGTVVALLVLGLVLARSKGAVLALGAGLFTLAALTVSAPAWRRRIVGGGLALFALALVAGAVQYRRAPESWGVSKSTQVRLEYSQAALGMIRDAPLTGHGLERYTALMPRYKSARAEEARHTHMDLLELAAELGVLGPIAFLALAFALGRAGVHALRAQGPPRAPQFESFFAPGATATLGVALGALTLLTYGEPWNSEVAAKPLLGGAMATAVLFLVARALLEPRWALAGAAACLAGAAVFLVDGLTDFPLRVHGLVAFAFALAFLAPALAEGPTSPEPAHPALRAAVGLPLAALLVFGQYRVHEDVPADGLREEGRSKINDTVAFFKNDEVRPERHQRAEKREAAAQDLRRGNEIHRRLLESHHLGVPDILLLVEGEEYEGRLARDKHRLDGTRKILRDAIEQYPSSFQLWTALGRLEAFDNLLEGATASFDEATRCYPGDPHGRLNAAVIRLLRIKAGEPAEALRADAIREGRAALACALTSRLDRIRLTDEEIVEAQGILVSLGAAPEPPGSGDPPPPLAGVARPAPGR